LTKKTTSVNELSKKTTYKKICQKTPPLGGGKSGQLTGGTCHHWQSRHVLAAIARAKTGMYLPPLAKPACTCRHC
jgi:hypothetical protein